MAETLMMMAVHAHPDRQALRNGGVLASYSAQGIRTALLARADGGTGAPGGSEPGRDGHDERASGSGP